jgi:hypothetical protein
MKLVADHRLSIVPPSEAKDVGLRLPSNVKEVYKLTPLKDFDV